MSIAFLTLLAATVMLFNIPLAARTGLWTGTISDSYCGISHDAMTEHGKNSTDKQCTQTCVIKGAKYVFVNNHRVLTITNQNLPDLHAYAGERVLVSGDRVGDAIMVAKVIALK